MSNILKSSIANRQSKILYVVCGPTAVGKTDFAIELAEKFGTEILSADSRQLYREIPIGTAQPSAEQLNRVKHHFVANRSLEEDYNAGMFERDALEHLDMLFQKHDKVICCGGTGLYIKALCDGLDDVPKADEKLRQQLTERLENEGLESLQTQLKQLDPVHFEKMDSQNPQRVIRALEVCLSTGKPFSSFHVGEKSERTFKIIKIGLELSRDELNERINQRVDMMLENGWLVEAKAVFEKRHLNALNTVGYKELFAHLSGEMNLEEATEKIKINTRRFAKRQMTWFKNDEEIKWFKPTDSNVFNSIED
ncbi:MAG: tRNA (adenosine(37)-N6)-dimethylallyltransferase MiaA [Flavobacteriales bacterium]|jgi:tRNA dimethylallyltransferase|nr:tRNA (adenosine(37)-N6)-dimethylallyltransferase MiaA [Flavobacteriales bacterium]